MVTHRFDSSHHLNPKNVTFYESSKESWLSVVVPARNEAENLPQLIEEITSAFRPLISGQSTNVKLHGFEIIVVDDGSSDSTPEVLLDLMVKHRELQPIRLASSVGQSSATVAGIREARGGWIGVLDADLQNHPGDLVRLWNSLPGYDAALGWRVKREDIWSKRIVSFWSNRIRNTFLKQSIKDTGCSVRIFRREKALQLPTFHGMHRFLGPLLLREGCRIIQLPVIHRPRTRGKSHYTIWNRSLRVIVDLFGVAWLMRRPVHCQVHRLGRQATTQPHFLSSMLREEQTSQIQKECPA